MSCCLYKYSYDFFERLSNEIVSSSLNSFFECLDDLSPQPNKENSPITKIKSVRVLRFVIRLLPTKKAWLVGTLAHLPKIVSSFFFEC